MGFCAIHGLEKFQRCRRKDVVDKSLAAGCDLNIQATMNHAPSQHLGAN